MRINLRKTKPMKRDLVYTTDDWRLRPFDPTRVFAPSPHQNRQFAPPVEKVGLSCSVVGALETVKRGFDTFIGPTGTDEVMVTAQTLRPHGPAPSRSPPKFMALSARQRKA